ncbi:MAG TPA: ABC transporter substrate-binding protein [Chloroflexota bacterium]
MMFKRVASVAAISIVLLVSACAAPPRAGSSDATANRPATPARIVAGVRGSPKVLSDRTSTIQPGHVPGLDALQDLVVAGLVIANDAGVIVAQLADAVPWVDNGRWKVFPEGRMQTSWTIRPNVTWQDGTPLTTTDLVFTAEVEQDPEMGFNSSAAYELIESVEATDDRTVTVTWKQPYIEADFMFSAMFALPMPKHLLEATYRADKANFFALPLLDQRVHRLRAAPREAVGD